MNASSNNNCPCFILIFLVAGFGLTICWVGIPIVIFLFKIIEKLTEKEINFTENFLPIELKRIQFNSYSGESLLNKFKLYIKDKKVWRYIRFYVLKFPITVVTLTEFSSSNLAERGTNTG